EKQQLPKMLGTGQPQRRKSEQRHADIQHRTRADAIDDKSRQRLADARHHKKRRHQQTEFGVADAKFNFQQRKQRRQDQMEKMADAMREADQADDFGIAAPRIGWWFKKNFCGTAHRNIRFTDS